MYRIPVIFDVDTGLDDALALFMACRGYIRREPFVRFVLEQFEKYEAEYSAEKTG